MIILTKLRTFRLGLLVITLLILSSTSYAESAAQTLYLLGYDIPADERDSVVAEDIAALSEYQQKRIDSTLRNTFEEDAPTLKLSSYDHFNTRDLQLCPLKDVLDCVAKVEQNPVPYQQSMQQLEPVLEDIARLKQADSDELRNIYPKDLQLPQTRIPNYNLLSEPIITQSVLAFHNDPNQGILTLCENIAFSKKLILSQDNLIQSMVGKYMLDSHLELLAQTSQPLPSSCVEALTPLTVDEIMICPLVQAEAKQMMNLIRGLPQIPIVFNHQDTILQLEMEAKPYCKKQWYEQLANDRIVDSPFKELYQPKLFNRHGMRLINVAKTDYTTYQHKLQDINAHLKLWQIAMHPQCSNLVSEPNVLNHLYTDYKPSDNHDVNDILEMIRASIVSIRALRVDEQQRLTITAYDQSDYKKVTGTIEDLTFIRVSCRTVQ